MTSAGQSAARSRADATDGRMRRLPEKSAVAPGKLRYFESARHFVASGSNSLDLATVSWRNAGFHPRIWIASAEKLRRPRPAPDFKGKRRISPRNAGFPGSTANRNGRTEDGAVRRALDRFVAGNSHRLRPDLPRPASTARRSRLGGVSAGARSPGPTGAPDGSRSRRPVADPPDPARRHPDVARQAILTDPMGLRNSLSKTSPGWTLGSLSDIGVPCQGFDPPARCRVSSHRLRDPGLSPEGWPKRMFSALMSSSRSGQWIPSPSPIRRQWLRSSGVAWTRRGYQASGTETTRPSLISAVSASSVTRIWRNRGLKAPPRTRPLFKVPGSCPPRGSPPTHRCYPT